MYIFYTPFIRIDNEIMSQSILIEITELHIGIEIKTDNRIGIQVIDVAIFSLD